MHLQNMRLASFAFPVLLAYPTGAQSTNATQSELSQLYAPTYVTCPNNVQWVRPAVGLNPSEAEWIQARKAVVFENFGQYLDRLCLEDFNLSYYKAAISDSCYKNVPHLGFAISGGGWASAYTGTGLIRAMDDRNPASVQQRTGGLLQSMLYHTGLSGGSFPAISFTANDYPSVEDIVKIWQPNITKPGADNVTAIFEDIAAKYKAGFPVTITDFFGRTWGYEFVPGFYGGVETTFSGFVDIPSFKNHTSPMPILHTSGILPTDPQFFGLQLDTTNGTAYEITPFEFGAWQGDFSSFTPTEWLGTQMKGGVPVNMSSCVRGFDKASFMMGSSASAVNMWYIEDNSNGTLGLFAKRSDNSSDSDDDLFHSETTPLSVLTPLIQQFNKSFGEDVNVTAYAQWPNPFIGLNSTTPALRDEKYIKLVDGSENGQVDPLWSLIQPARGLDFIITWDNGGDAHPYHWNNGTAVYETYRAAVREGIPFPIIPSSATFIKNNYTHKPVFFGCDANLTTTKSADAPIVLYFANAPYSSYSNYSAGQAVMPLARLDDIFVNSFNQVTAGNGTLDAEFAQCIGCAAIDRSLARVGMKRTVQCQRCMERYCWHGENVPEDIVGPPGGTYIKEVLVDLEMVLRPGVTFAEWNATVPPFPPSIY